VAHPAGSLFFLAKRSAERLSRKMPPFRPSTSRAIQKTAFVSRDKEQGDCFIKNGRVGTLRELGYFVGNCAQLATRIRSLLVVCHDDVHLTKRRHARDVASLLLPTEGHRVWTVPAPPCVVFRRRTV